jgi:hypothetical protein
MTKYFACLAAAIILLALVPNAEARFREQSPVDWRTFEVPDFGTRIQYPANIFTRAGRPEMGLGQRFERADGRAVLSIYARSNNAGETPQNIFKKTSPRGAIRVGLRAHSSIILRHFVRA